MSGSLSHSGMACVNKGMKGSHNSRLLTIAVLNVAGLWECHGKMFSFGSRKFGGVIVEP